MNIPGLINTDQYQGAIGDALANDRNRLAAQQQLSNLQAPQNPYAGGGQYLGSSDYLRAIQANNAYQAQRSGLMSQAGQLTPDQARRSSDIAMGTQRGTELFYNDPDMMAQRDRLIGLSKGYSGGELGAMQEQARQNIAGQRGGYMRELSGKLAKQGVGGARAAAMQGAADVGFAGKGAEAERGMLLDSAKMARQGTQDLGDYMMKQKYGVLTSGLGEAQLGSSDYAAQQARAAAQGGQKQGLLSGLFSGLGL